MQKITHSPILSSSLETNQNIPDTQASWKQTTIPWSPVPAPSICSLVQAKWSDPISNLSTDSTCFCPVGNKASNTINNVTVYKCQILYPTVS
jgi:hypothetical protein